LAFSWIYEHFLTKGHQKIKKSCLVVSARVLNQTIQSFFSGIKEQKTTAMAMLLLQGNLKLFKLRMKPER